MRAYQILAYLLAAIVSTLLVSGCTGRTISYAPVDSCSKPLDPSMARIILNRSLGYVAGGIRWDITDSGQPVGAIANAGQLCWDRYPGKAILVAEVQAAIGFTGVYSTNFEFEVKPSSLNYVVVHLTWSGTPEFYRDPAHGQ
jgi:hypothetical protein